MQSIPDSTIERLPRYRQSLEELLATGRTHVSSDEIARRLGLSAAQIRKDLSYFGNFGVRGKGYDLKNLIRSITKIMGLDRAVPCILIGVGNIGRALLAYPGFEQQRFTIRAAFDSDPDKVGTAVNDVTVRPAEELNPYLEQHDTNIAIVAVPATAAPAVLDQLVDGDVRAILNFAPVVYEPPEDVMIKSVDLTSDLEVLNYFLHTPT